MQHDSIERAYHDLMDLGADPSVRAIRERLGGGSRAVIALASSRLRQGSVGGTPEFDRMRRVVNTIGQKE